MDYVCQAAKDIKTGETITFAESRQKRKKSYRMRMSRLSVVHSVIPPAGGRTTQKRGPRNASLQVQFYF